MTKTDPIHMAGPWITEHEMKVVEDCMRHGWYSYDYVEKFQDELARYHLFHAARADLLRRLDRTSDARAAYEEALELCQNEAERRFLSRRLAAL